VYSRAGTLFLDDGKASSSHTNQSVISAVDALTAHALVENCLQGDLIRGRTVIMVSHHTALVAPAAAYVVALDKVSLWSQGIAEISGRRQVRWHFEGF
jgi:ABC-type glutathione transport system ATPase component